MRSRLTVMKSPLLVWGLIVGLTLLLYYLDSLTAGAEIEIAASSPSPTAVNEIEGIAIEEVLESASKIPALKSGKKIGSPWCEGNVTVNDFKRVDINRDGDLDQLVELICDKMIFSPLYPHLLVGLSSIGKDEYTPILVYPFTSAWSQIEIEDLDGDDNPEVRIESYFSTGGSGMSHKYWEYIYLACEQEACKIVWEIRPLERLWAKIYESGFGTLQVSPTLVNVSRWELVSYGGDTALLVTTNQIKFYEPTFVPPISTPHSVYDIEFAAPIKKLYVKNEGVFTFEDLWLDGEKQRIAPQMPYMEFQGRLAHKATYFLGAAPSDEEVVDFVDQEGYGQDIGISGIPDMETYDYEGYVKLVRYRESTSEYYRCELSVHESTGKWQEYVRKATIDLPCAPNLTDLQMRPLGGLGATSEYILVFTVDTHLGSPVHRLTIYKWDGEKIVKLDEIEGRLYVLGMDGVVLNCEDYSPCTLRVRHWDYSPVYGAPIGGVPPAPTYVDLVWDPGQERFVNSNQ